MQNRVNKIKQVSAGVNWKSWVQNRVNKIKQVSDGVNWKSWVQNRVNKIKQVSAGVNWKYVNTTINHAGIGTLYNEFS